MFAVGQDEGLNRRHAELVIRELAKFHAMSFCMKDGSNERILQKYKYLMEDSLYREGTADCSVSRVLRQHFTRPQLRTSPSSSTSPVKSPTSSGLWPM